MVDLYLQITVLSNTAMPTPIVPAPSAWRTTLDGVKNAVRSSGFSNMPGGSHGTCDGALLTLAQLVAIKKNDIVWDIGVGYPKLAFFFSMLTHSPVVGTDIGKCHLSVIC